MCFIGQLSAQQLSFERVYTDDYIPTFTSEFLLTPNASYVKGDLDSDGDIDLIVIGGDSYRLSGQVYLSDGFGNYKLDNSSVTPAVNGSLALGDIDSDGDLDCIVSGRINNSGRTTICINDGIGNFSISQFELPWLKYSDLVLGDVDGDNDLDLFLTGTDNNSNALTGLFLNDGLGEFVLDSLNSFEQLKASVANFIDIDNDSDLDIISSGESSPGIFKTIVYLNNGSGNYTFDSRNQILGSTNGQLKSIDANNDNYPDLIISGVRGGGFDTRTLLYLNDSGVLKLDTSNNFPYITNGSISTTDLNNDGNLDIMVISSLNTNPKTELFYNIGNGKYVEDSLNTITDASVGCVVPLDLNADGYQDLLILGEDRTWNPLSDMFLNDQNGQFNKVEVNIMEVLLNGVSINSDIDKDGDLDLFMTGRDEKNRAKSLLYKNDGSGNFQRVNSSILNVQDGESVFVDIDLDLDDDLIVSGKNSSGVPVVYIYTNDGLGNFSKDPINTLQGVYRSSIEVADFNRDGDLDILIAGSINLKKSSTRLYLGNNGRFLLDSTLNIKDLGFGSLAVGDIDNDNDIDIFITGEGVDSTLMSHWGKFSMVYFNDGNGNFTLSNISNSLPQVANGNAELSDLNGDGLLDLIFSGPDRIYSTATGLRIYLNDSSGGFRYSRYLGGSIRRYQPFLVDIDNDNDLDIINDGISDIIFLNDSLGEFTLFESNVILPTIYSENTFFDMDGDSDIDLLFRGSSAFNSRSIFLYRNNLISKVGLEKRNLKDHFMLFPNPSNGMVSIVDQNHEIERLELYTLNGQLITSQELSQNTSHQFVLPEQKGIYLLMIYTENNQSAQRVVKY